MIRITITITIIIIILIVAATLSGCSWGSSRTSTGAADRAMNAVSGVTGDDPFCTTVNVVGSRRNISSGGADSDRSDEGTGDGSSGNSRSRGRGADSAQHSGAGVLRMDRDPDNHRVGDAEPGRSSLGGPQVNQLQEGTPMLASFTSSWFIAIVIGAIVGIVVWSKYGRRVIKFLRRGE